MPLPIADAEEVRPLTRLRLPPHSRYRLTLLYPTLGVSFGRWSHQPASIKEHHSDLFHTVANDEQFRLDLISFRRYGTKDMWWVLALANNLFNPFTEPAAGDTLRVPAYERIVAELLMV